ncbi:MAG: CHAD domain-containing protein [Armatimonadetes bacterium]|nr:CHAD domain-containing protein [Armatimonadota bacterium]
MRRGNVVHGVDPSGTIADNAAIIICSRVQDLLEWERWIREPERVAELHRMRIAAKRLRYTLELFEPIVGKPVSAAIESMKEVQELLGSIHDLDVVTPLLVTDLRRALRMGRRCETWLSVDYCGVAGLATLCRAKFARRRAQHRRFVAAWRQLRKSGVLDALCRPDLCSRGQQGG